ncbi:glycosyltransferase family 2 protein [Leisingera methylohalidivorans]|uniref:Glycosyl transferase n=1 Tax=Leisingera methylohalidivorans DSM 14336 TaxID=999552 RepID=V9VWE5_9RHOB|nr:glycosyltransferase family 2 protein [Leisingera methylohalidivorans]AHD01685.1 glycosyl transferase [Leisingera methylohalidivorans DSM 14336]
MDQQRILTILLNYRTPEMTLQAAAAALREMENLPGELLIIDNGSGDGSYEQIRAQAEARGWLASGCLRVIAAPVNGGFGAGMNIGIKAGLSDGSAPEFYYLLNSDAFVQGRTIRTLRDFLLEHPGAGLAGSYVRGTDGTPHRTAFRFPSIAGEFEASVRTGMFTRLLKPWVVAMDLPQAELQVDWTAGASLMIRREAAAAVGGFDETFFLYFEETDLCRRAARAGWRTHYVPASEIAHVGSASTGMKAWQRTPHYWFDSRRHYFVKHHGHAYAAAATLARAAGSLIYGLRRLIQNKPQADPPYFLRDLILYSLRAMAAPRPEPSQETRPPSSLAKEPK